MSCVSSQGVEPGCQLSNLWPGCSYLVRVRAQNSAGFGATSAPVEVATAPDVPEPPSNLHVATRQVTRREYVMPCTTA